MVQNNRDPKDVNRRLLPSPGKAKGRPRILLAEDDDEMRTLLARVLYADGYAVAECRDGIDLFGRIEPFVVREVPLDVDAIVSDICMPGLTGLEILEDLHDRAGFPPVILITAFGDKGIHARAERAGVAAMLDKPFGIDELLAKLHKIVSRQLA